MFIINPELLRTHIINYKQNQTNKSMKTTEIINASVAKRIDRYVDPELVANGRLVEVTVDIMDRVVKDGKVEHIVLALDKSIGVDTNVDEISIDIDKFENNLVVLGVDTNINLEGKTIQLICIDDCAGYKIWTPGSGGSWESTRANFVHYIGGIVE